MLNGGLESSEGDVSRQVRGTWRYADGRAVEKGCRRNVRPHRIERESSSCRYEIWKKEKGRGFAKERKATLVACRYSPRYTRPPGQSTAAAYEAYLGLGATCMDVDARRAANRTIYRNV